MWPFKKKPKHMGIEAYIKLTYTYKSAFDRGDEELMQKLIVEHVPQSEPFRSFTEFFSIENSRSFIETERLLRG